MGRIKLSRPALVLIYGYPGAGKTQLAASLCRDLELAHVEADKIRSHLTPQPLFDKSENERVGRLSHYLTVEMLKAGVSVLFDINAARFAARRALRDLGRRYRATPVLLWLQIDAESAFNRIVNRDRTRSPDGRRLMDRSMFDDQLGRMQNPDSSEDYLVISGKHNYHTQRSAVIKKLYELGLITAEAAGSHLIKPGLVNLVPGNLPGRVDPTRRQIAVR